MTGSAGGLLKLIDKSINENGGMVGDGQMVEAGGFNRHRS